MAAGDDREQRLAFVVPPIAEPPPGIDPAYLDPADDDERSLLLRAAHADLDAAIRAGQETVVVGDLEVNPRLHLAMHELVADQILNDAPPEVWTTAKRLRAAGYSRHEVLHMLAATMSGEIWHVMTDRREYDLQQHLDALGALPDSWERQRPGASAPPASGAAQAGAAKQRRKSARVARRRNRRR